MGNEHTKPSEKLKWIDREVNSIRSSIRSTRRRIPNETKEEYIQGLAKFSGEASALKGKVKQKQLDQIQRNISDAMNEVLTKEPQESDLDLGAVETNSFIQVPINKRQSLGNVLLSEKPAKKQKKTQVEIAKTYYTTLQDIEEKLRTLKPQVNVAIQIKDTTQLRVHQKTIKILATDLEMIEVSEDTSLGDKKKKLDSGITLQYQKISKAMKEIKRNKDMDYLLQQSKKEKALSELADIKTNLEEADLLLKGSLRDNDSMSIKNILDNLMKINQRLSSIEVPDEKTKSVKMQLMDKITWLCKYINESATNEGQSDLSKAQSNYEDIVKNIASGNNKDKNEIKAKLQSLQAFITNIKEDDDSSLKRKQQLLNNVKQSFSFMLEDGQDTQNSFSNTYSKAKKANTIYKELDDFYNLWKSVQKDIKSTTYSDEESAKIEKVLDDIHRSIEQTRSQVGAGTNPTSNLTKKLNISTPELRSPPIHSKFSSSLSVDQLSSGIIKTRVKLYNISTPEIQNINDQSVVLRNKKMHRSNAELQNAQRFSKIEEIRRQVDYIKEKFPESQQKQHLKNKLESYVEMLEQYINNKNENTANNAKLLLEDVQDMLRSMSNVQEVLNYSSNRRMSIEESFENVAGLQDAVDKMTEVIQQFSGTKDGVEYNKIKDELFSLRGYLKNADISPKYEMIKQQKDEILKKIDLHFDSLENRCDEFDCYKDPDTVHFKRRLGSLRERVTRFSGAYKSVLYNSIEKNLNDLLLEADDKCKDKDQRVAKGIKTDGEKLLKILEHRATKDQSFRRTISQDSVGKDQEKFQKLKVDLEDIKAAVNSSPPHHSNSILGLKSQLDLVKIEVDQIKTHDNKQKDILYMEINNLVALLDGRLAVTNKPLPISHSSPDKINEIGEELSRLQTKFEVVKQEIESFVGTTSDSKFYDLDECCTIIMLRMENMDVEQGTELYNKKINLVTDINNHRNLLDKRVEETEVLVETERAIYDVEKNFGRYIRLNDLENLESKVNTLRDKIINSKCNRNLIERKQICLIKIEDLVNKVRYSKNSANKGTENSTSTMEEALSKIQLQLSNVKKEIEDFIGIHADRKYYELHGNITGLFSKLDGFHVSESSNLHAKKNKLLQEINLYCDILDRKAKDTEIIREITKQLGVINSKIDNYKGSNEELQVMKTELKSVQMKMDQVKLSDDRKKILKSKYDILYGEYTRFNRTLETAKSNYIGSSTFAMDVQNKNKATQYVPGSLESQIANIQGELAEINRKVKVFTASDTSEEFREIEETLLRLQVKLNKLPILNNELYKQKADLEKEVTVCLELLDERAQEADIIMDIEKKLDYLSKRLDNATTDDERNAIDEKLITLQVQLGKLQVNDDLTPRKEMCTDRIIIYLRHLKKQSTT